MKLGSCIILAVSLSTAFSFGSDVYTAIEDEIFAGNVWPTKTGELLRKAKADAEMGRYDEATKVFKLAAEQGYPEGMYHLGKCYLQGTGVVYSKGLGQAYVYRAAEAGVPDAQLEWSKQLSGDLDKRVVSAKWALLASKTLSVAKDRVEHLKGHVLTKDDLDAADAAAKSWKPKPINRRKPFEDLEKSFFEPPTAGPMRPESLEKNEVSQVARTQPPANGQALRTETIGGSGGSWLDYPPAGSQTARTAPTVNDLFQQPVLLSGEDVKQKWLAIVKTDERGQPASYQGKSGRLLREFQNRVRLGEYDLHASATACRWNISVYQRAGDSSSAQRESDKLTDLVFKIQQIELQRRQAAATEAAARAASDISTALNQLNWELFQLR